MRFLLTTLPTNDLGLLARSLPIARELSARGHQALFCSPAPAPSRVIADAGFQNLVPDHPLYDLVRLEHGARGLARLLARGGSRRGGRLAWLRDLLAALPWRTAPGAEEVWNADHAGAVMGMLNPGFVRAHCQALVGVIAACAPDVVVDFWNPFAAIAARATGKPLVTVIQADAHPRSRGFVWWKAPPAGLPAPAPVVNRVLAGYGLEPVPTIADLSVGDLTLVVGTPETDPLPEGVEATWLGAILEEERRQELPRWIDALDPGRPTVWVYSGNPRYGWAGGALDSAVVIRACAEALAGEDLQVVLTTGHHPLPRDLLPLPPNFRHEPWVPGPAMAERSRVLVHHGGYGSCQAGLLAGKPAVIMPTFSERESNARRMAALGAALLVPVDRSNGEKHVRAEALRAAVRGVLEDPSYAEQARRAGQRLRALGGAARAATLIERFARGDGRSRCGDPRP